MLAAPKSLRGSHGQLSRIAQELMLGAIRYLLAFVFLSYCMAKSFRALAIAMLIVVSAVLFSAVSGPISLGAVYDVCSDIGCDGGVYVCASYKYGDSTELCFTTPPQKL